MKEFSFDMEAVRKSQLKVLDVVAKFCDEHDIKYFLAFGTLIGAVRHKGYIPWDDDIDIVMLRPDYDKFRELFNENNTDYHFDCLENSSKAIFPLKGDVVDSNSQDGSIDVFCMDNVPDDEKLLRTLSIHRKIYRALWGATVFTVSGPAGGSPFRKCCVRAFRILARVMLIRVFFSPRYFAEKITQEVLQYSHDKTKRVAHYDVDSNRILAINRVAVENVINGEFEGKFYKIPAGYDEWLRLCYGDYMQLPPESERVPKHHK